MDAVIKIISGPDSGQTFQCSAPETILGRSQRSTVRLTSPTISYEHAIISRTGDDYFLENLSANGTFLNNERINAKTRLRPKDQVRIGDDTVVRVESVPSSTSSSSSRTLLLVVFVFLIVALLVVVFLDPFSGTSTRQTATAYHRLHAFALKQRDEGKLPADTITFLEEAWRLEVANDRPNAKKAWLRLRSYLDSLEPTTGYIASTRSYPRALDTISDPATPPPADTDIMGAALVEFATQREARK